MTVLGMAETVEDVELWAISRIKACVDVRFIDKGCASLVGAIIDTAMEPSTAVWRDAIKTYSPEWMFGPVCYDGGELGSYLGRVERAHGVDGLSPIPRAGADAALDAIRGLELKEIALEWADGPGGWNHWLLEGVGVWLVGAPSPRDQWLTWLELTHRKVDVKGIVLDPPSKHTTHRLSPSNLAPLWEEDGMCGPVNARIAAAFWEAVLPGPKTYRRMLEKG